MGHVAAAASAISPAGARAAIKVRQSRKVNLFSFGIGIPRLRRGDTDFKKVLCASAQRVEDGINLSDRVVVGHRRPDHPAAVFQTQPLGQILGVIVAVLDEDGLFAQSH